MSNDSSLDQTRPPDGNTLHDDAAVYEHYGQFDEQKLDASVDARIFNTTTFWQMLI